MLVDIFSSFDPFILTPFRVIHRFWLGILIISLPLILNNLWIGASSRQPIAFLRISAPFSQGSLSLINSIKGSLIIIITLFPFILTLNLLGLIPYSFGFSNHLFLTLTLGLPLWLTIFISSFAYDTRKRTAILLPEGPPTPLIPFLILVETVRTLVRPLTLSLRLAANITAGHIILGLLGTYLSHSTFVSSASSSVLILIISGYNIFEFIICVIQAYIFCLLISLYARDHAS